MMTSDNSILAEIQSIQTRVNQLLKDTIPSTYPEQLANAIRHSLLDAGKRIRPFLVYNSFQLFETTLNKIDSVATAVELIHTYSLIHDDLPAMDNDDLRRGKPTCHKAFSEDIAILAGDTLNTLAFELLSTQLPHYFDASLCLEAIHCLSKAAGAQGMIGGQVYDMHPIQTPTTLKLLKQTHQLKTGALITASLYIPAILCTATSKQRKALHQFGHHLGLLFQITDDILDVTGNAKSLGKTPNKDHEQNKSTYVTLLGINDAKKMALAEAESAKKSLNLFTNNQQLYALTNFILNRTA